VLGRSLTSRWAAKSDGHCRCEFAYVECDSSPVKDAYRADVVPVLILRHRGQELARFVNTLEVEKVRQAIAEVAA
jgi:thioredoxin-like negative regulator of GroEL